MAKLTPTDSRVEHRSALIRGQNYHFIVAKPPSGQPIKGTIILIHGFPDLGFGWRNQVPVLAEELGLQVIVPDMLGYGGTDSPEDPSRCSYKNSCADLVEIVDHVGVQPPVADNKFFVGGHDWGGATAWRMALWHPDRVRSVFAICTPFFPPSKNDFMPMDVMVKHMPSFGYQRQFSSDALYKYAGPGQDEHIRQVLQTLYGGGAYGTADETDHSGELFDTTNGVNIEKLSNDIVPTKLLNAEEMDYYVSQFSRHGFQGPTNWYRNAKVNYDDERVFVTGDKQANAHLEMPALMVTATHDTALPVALSANMHKFITNLTHVQVTAGHWALWQATEKCNEHIKSFLAPLIDAAPKSSL